MQIVTQHPTYPWPISPKLGSLIAQEVKMAGMAGTRGCTLVFRDPCYCTEKGGFHPVEINVGPQGVIAYITDFALVGEPPFEELAKEIDFDFSQGIFQHMGRVFPLRIGHELFRVWQRNFLDYHRMGVYRVEVSGP